MTAIAKQPPTAQLGQCRFAEIVSRPPLSAAAEEV